jgi:hypothetical protein
MNILELLKQGARIVFPDGMYMDGDPETNYIEVGSEAAGSDGLQILNEDGVEKSLAQIKSLRTERDTPYEE